MLRKKVIIKSKVGLHARPAALFVQTAGKFLCDIHIEMGDKKVNAKSIMGIMVLGASKGILPLDITKIFILIKSLLCFFIRLAKPCASVDGSISSKCPFNAAFKNLLDHFNNPSNSGFLKE